ncbi:hypothetical protein CIB84_007150 [Bambusicola thoracicus]|uniref:Uncharacterized protein n=1 Tax=Bambusicola thoracicus TaxID=9083 RepID=A0A2P4SYA8_BAMTH|nr:hypothetical protein CIB84_007150 [Bambusicola thoracicus]
MGSRLLPAVKFAEVMQPGSADKNSRQRCHRVKERVGWFLART